MTTPRGAGDESGQAPAYARTELELLDDLIADYEADHGPVPDELVEEATRDWPDHEGG